ncbi:DUF6387 family protein [Limnobaculum xujianqingii]|uniref:DUF6387 family protein n=1 Tax=Limnobaculum xujianqingii TaxID=2738837 RepID=UPI00112DE862|nr:DUF6387 family protein [Limnobaculum xujianqingii]
MSIERLNNDMEKIQEEITSTQEALKIIQSLNLNSKDIISMVDVKTYDELSKDFKLIDYYLSFKKRESALEHIENITLIRNDTYEDYVNSFSLDDEDKPLAKEEYEVDKEQQILVETIDLIKVILRILAGDNVSIWEEDLIHIRRGIKEPIKLIDMKDIAFKNRYCGFMGGMSNESYNEIIAKAIHQNASLEDLHKLKEIPDGYGWAEDQINEGLVWAEIDLNAPDDILLDGFKNWLVRARAHHNTINGNVTHHSSVKNNVKPAHMKKWHSMRVLAYLDIKIFSSFINAPLTLNQYADALYFDEPDIDTTEKVRKTLIPLVNEILSGYYLNNLMKKITSEIRLS